MVAKMQETMRYKKYFSNGDLGEVNDHICICCKRVKNNTDIFVFDTERDFPTERSRSPFANVGLNKKSSVITTSGSTGITSSSFTAAPAIGSPIRAYDSIFMCGECIYKLSQKLSDEVVKKIVAEGI